MGKHTFRDIKNLPHRMNTKIYKIKLSYFGQEYGVSPWRCLAVRRSTQGFPVRVLLGESYLVYK